MKILKILETVKNFIKKNKKLVTVVSAMFCAVVLVAGSIAGTIAYLTDNATVTNTFTVGDIVISMNESKVDEYGVAADPATRVTANTYKLIPGHTYTKDPVITVEANSEACYVFVKIDNQLAAIEGATTIASQITSDAYGWTALPDVDNVYYKTVDAATAKTGTKLDVFGTFSVSGTADVSSYADKTIVVTAYAIQSNGFDTAAAAWAAGNKTADQGGWLPNP